MSIGTFYRVEPDLASRIADHKDKAAWYEAMADVQIESAEQLDAEDALPIWFDYICKAPSPLNRLLTGDLNTYDEEGCAGGDPDVVFLGKALTAELADARSRLTRSDLQSLFNIRPLSLWQRIKGERLRGDDTWLAEPLAAFLRESADEGMAVLILWENG